MMFAYLLGDTGDVIALSSDFNRLADFAQSRSEGEIRSADWNRQGPGAWSCVRGRYDRVWWSHPATEAMIVAIDDEEIV